MLSSKVIIVILVTLLVAAAGAAIYFYQKANIDPQQEAVKDLQNTITLVSRHLVLPEGETPTLATVSDPEKLRDQPFFANAKKGYKVLIYASSQKAILYDPINDRIVEVAPINTQVSPAAEAGAN